jgi:hypothetical protein
MRRFGQALFLLLFCTGCGSKPSPQVNASLPGQVPPAVTSSPQANAQMPMQGASQPQARIQARAVLLPAPAEAPKPPIAHDAVATISGAQRILFAAASPTAEEIFVLAQMSNDTYGGAFFVVRLDGAGNKTETVMEGTNAEYSDAPVWSPDGATAYFVFDNGNILPPGNETGHGLLVWDRRTGKVNQILKDSIGGLAISADGTLAGFWDYSAGDNLTVYDLKKQQVVRAWAGQTHSADDLVLSDLAFAPDGKSLLARLFVPKEDPVMQYEIASGKITLFAKNVQSMVTTGDSLYFLQFEPVPFTNPEHARRLMKWTPGISEPVPVVEDFRYVSLSASPGSPWLIGGSNGGYADGAAIYDTRTGQIKTAGKSCGSALVTASGKVLYTFGNELVADAAVCSGPLPPRLASQE